MERTELPIAVFDSGLGGISVLRALVAVLQAMTAALMPRSYSRPMTSCVRRRTSATGRTP